MKRNIEKIMLIFTFLVFNIISGKQSIDSLKTTIDKLEFPKDIENKEEVIKSMKSVGNFIKNNKITILSNIFTLHSLIKQIGNIYKLLIKNKINNKKLIDEDTSLFMDYIIHKVINKIVSY